MNYKIPNEIFSQEVDEEIILLDSRDYEYYSFNGIGKDIWILFLDGLTLSEIKKELKEVYEVDVNQLNADIDSFISSLEERKLLLKVQ